MRAPGRPSGAATTGSRTAATPEPVEIMAVLASLSFFVAAYGPSRRKMVSPAWGLADDDHGPVERS